MRFYQTSLRDVITSDKNCEPDKRMLYLATCTKNINSWENNYHLNCYFSGRNMM